MQFDYFSVQESYMEKLYEPTVLKITNHGFLDSEERKEYVAFTMSFVCVYDSTFLTGNNDYIYDHKVHMIRQDSLCH